MLHKINDHFATCKIPQLFDYYSIPKINLKRFQVDQRILTALLLGGVIHQRGPSARFIFWQLYRLKYSFNWCSIFLFIDVFQKAKTIIGIQVIDFFLFEKKSLEGLMSGDNTRGQASIHQYHSWFYFQSINHFYKKLKIQNIYP